MLTVPSSIHVCTRVRVAVSRFARCRRSTRSSRRHESPRSLRNVRTAISWRLSYPRELWLNESPSKKRFDSMGFDLGFRIRGYSALHSAPRTHTSRGRRRAVDRLCRFASSCCPLTKPAFFLQGKVQTFCETTECQSRTAQRRILLRQPGQFLATT